MKAVFIGADPRAIDLAYMSFRLRWPNADTLVAASAGDGLKLIEKESPNIVLIHPDFTDKTLAQAIRELRSFSSVPLLIIGHQADEMEVVTSLETGADDYVRMPCDLTELMVRIWALLRRAGSNQEHQDSEGQLVSGPLSINPATYEVFMEENRITLTSTEFRLLHLLMKNRGTVVGRDVLERSLWGEEVDSYGLVKKYIQRLRSKLKDDARHPIWIASVHGIGYRFIGPNTAPPPVSESHTAR